MRLWSFIGQQSWRRWSKVKWRDSKVDSGLLGSDCVESSTRSPRGRSSAGSSTNGIAPSLIGRATWRLPVGCAAAISQLAEEFLINLWWRFYRTTWPHACRDDLEGGVLIKGIFGFTTLASPLHWWEIFLYFPPQCDMIWLMLSVAKMCPFTKTMRYPWTCVRFWKNWVTFDISFKVSEPNLVTRLARTPYIWVVCD